MLATVTAVTVSSHHLFDDLCSIFDHSQSMITEPSDQNLVSLFMRDSLKNIEQPINELRNVLGKRIIVL